VVEQGNILRMELLPSFGYLRLVSERIGAIDDTPESTKASNAGS